MAGEVLCFKRANIVHDFASELYGLVRVTKLPGNRVGISIRYCFAVRICMSSIAISSESVRGPPLSKVHATTTLNGRILLEKSVPEGTPNVWKVSEAEPRGARSKSSATSIKSVLNAAGSSWLGIIEALVSSKSGACPSRNQAWDLMVTESDGSTTLKISDRVSRI